VPVAGPETGSGAIQHESASPETPEPATAAVAWAVAHLAEREAVFARTDLLAAALSWPDFDGWAGFWLISDPEICAKTMT